MAEEAPVDLVTGAANFAARATQMIGTARTDVTVLTLDLDRRIYGGAALAEALSGFVRQHRNTKVRILVNATHLAIANSPRLVELGRGLSSFIEFRELQPQRQQVVREELVITDGRCMLYRESPHDLQARYYGDHPATVREKLKDFQVLWDESVTAQELRRLGT